MNRAVQAYRFFYPSVSIMATWNGNLRAGMVANKVFGLLEGTPKQFVFTPNSDTPYSGLPLDVADGPMVLEFPPGPLMSTANDLNQRWAMDMGLPGPDKGPGGRHVVVPPGYDGEVPEGFNVGRPTTNRVLVLLRALPRGKDMATAVALMKSVKVYRLGQDPVEPQWVDLTQKADEDFTPVPWEDNLTYWEVLAELLNSEPPFAEYRAHYGDLAELGIAKGLDFATARWSGRRHLASDPPRRRLVCLLPDLRSRTARLRRWLAAPRFPIRLILTLPSEAGIHYRLIRPFKAPTTCCLVPLRVSYFN